MSGFNAQQNFALKKRILHACTTENHFNRNAGMNEKGY